MPISLAIIACGCGLIYFGTRGFTEKGIQLSPKKTLVGPTGRMVGIICIICGVGLGVIGIGLLALIAARTEPRR